MTAYDAILVYSFGGPEGPDEVLPFLENVVRGRNVPRERLEEVSVHYHHFGGVSPINGLTEKLMSALKAELAEHGHDLPVYWGNRHWRPMITDTLRQMEADGVERALAFVTSALSSFSGCRAYRQDLEKAREAVGPGAPVVDKIRQFYDHPGYVETWQERLEAAIATFDEADRGKARLIYTAHSIPTSMAKGCDYEAQLNELAGILTGRLGLDGHDVVYQSRSGPPQVPWLGPDIGDHLKAIAAQAPGTPVVVAPIGFVADHMEVVWDLDNEAKEIAEEVGLPFARAETPNTHPRFVTMVRELIEERLDPSLPRPALGTLGVRPDRCVPGCCPAGGRPKRPGQGGPPGGGGRPASGGRPGA